ncbi:ornithine cyclodeaminase [Thermoplasma volcanium GSS1]|uniref:Ornithine cyclodeaminase n=1 Tax=Thermoplasma volcanium (strain ATCC 51530 / DSM 4299 / JCM 9571 / NBRC 15438 / GSS1) TaxID=273116 RepID=Q97AH2_THEVO|nr:ornithine cyclodeaminase [Thermoplasma volcanium]BAB59980.1 ornithine cyclodeaminase [Thermoplasma volcanium GSS1]
MYYVTEDDVDKNFDMKAAINAVREAFEEYGKGRAYSSTRVRTFSQDGVLNTMPAAMEKYHISGLKSYYATRNGAKFVVVLFDTAADELLAIIEANRLGQIRTGAVTAYATSILHKNVEIFAIIGSGFQAETQLEGMLKVANPTEIRVYSRNQEHARNFSERSSKKFGVSIRAVESAEAALIGADTITTITNSNVPIVYRKYLGDEYHINLAGSNYINRREAESAVLSDANIVVTEHLEQSLIESVEISEYVKLGGKPIELKDVAVDPTRYSKFHRTVFKSMGIGLEDIISGYAVLKNMGII